MHVRLGYARWMIGVTIVIMINIHISLWMRKVSDKPDGDMVHSESYRKLFRRSDGNSTPIVAHFSQATDSTSRFANEEVKEHSLDYLKQRDLNDRNSLRSHDRPLTKKRAKEKIDASEIPVEDYQLERSELPSFAKDHSDYILSSIIERSTSSSNLYLTTFFLCHVALMPGQTITIDKVSPEHRGTWRRAMETFIPMRYFPSGARMQELESEKFYCKIRHSSDTEYYTVPGVFLPNRLTNDNNANRLQDIMRCPMMDSVEAFRNYSRSNESVTVSVIRGEDVISTFTVPWSSRRTGHLQATPKAASRLDAWKGHYSTINEAVALTVNDPIDLLHICIPGSQRKANKIALPMILEYLSHHLLIGAGHITLPLSLPWGSPDMNRFIEVLQSFIQEGIRCFQSLN
jgi:hypothetical protein